MCVPASLCVCVRVVVADACIILFMLVDDACQCCRLLYVCTRTTPRDPFLVENLDKERMCLHLFSVPVSESLRDHACHTLLYVSKGLVPTEVEGNDQERLK